MTASAPIRCCAACRRRAPRTEFLRIVRQYDSGKVCIGSGMGRSAYLCPTEECIFRIEKKNRLAHILRSPVPKDIYKRLLAMVQTSPDA
ncbi:MAG: YlxR family protein [Synechococcus sp.]